MNAQADVDDIARAVRAEVLLQRVCVMTGDAAASAAPGVELGPVKIAILDWCLPELDVPVAQIRAARAEGRCVAIHAASRIGVLVAVAALREAGAVKGDRIEHASVVPDATVADIAELGVTVVTQPYFVAENGDRYLADVDEADIPLLYRCASLVRAGVPLAAGSDSPIGGMDPWQAMAAAVSRRCASGRVLGGDEALTPEQALGLFLGPVTAPGGPSRKVATGVPADLCLLNLPWHLGRQCLGDVRVVATTVGGVVVFEEPS